MFNKKELDILIVIKSNDLVFYSFNTKISKTLFLNPEIIKDQEIINKVNYTNLVTQFLLKEGIENKKIGIILDEDILYKKPITNFSNLITEQQSFIKELPFNTEKLYIKNLVISNNQSFVAVNKYLFELLINTLKQTNQVIFTTINFNKTLMPEFYKNYQQIQIIDFYSIKQPLLSVKNTVLTLAVIFLLCAIPLWFFKDNIKNIYNRPVINAPILETTQSTQPSQLETEEIKEEIKEVKQTTQAKITILNGTTISGLAAKAKTQLENNIKVEGFKISTVGNNPEKSSITNINYSTNVDENYVQTLAQELQTTFEEITVDNTLTTQSEILIILGAPKK